MAKSNPNACVLVNEACLPSKRIMTGQDIAVLDLGSNSFHMVVAQLEENQNLRIIDKIKLDVRLADGLDENRYLKKETMDRALLFLDQRKAKN